MLFGRHEWYTILVVTLKDQMKASQKRSKGYYSEKAMGKWRRKLKEKVKEKAMAILWDNVGWIDIRVFIQRSPMAVQSLSASWPLSFKYWKNQI